MKQIKYDNDEHLESIKRRAMIMKPNVPNVIATSMGWAQARPFGGMELLVSFADLDTILGIETEVQDELEPIVVNVTADEIDDDSDIPAPNPLANLIISKPVAKVEDEVLEKPDMQAFLAQLKSEDETEDDEEKVEEKPKKKGGRPKKVTE